MTTTARHAAGRPRLRTPSALTTTARIAAQLRADPRTVGIIIVMPLLLVTLLYYVFVDVPVPPGGRGAFDSLGPMMLAILPMMLMFIVTSVTMLRERTSGTLERLLTTPLSRWNLLASYGAVFGFLGVLQATLLGLLVLGPMGVEIAGPAWMLILLALLDALVGVAFGLLASAFARSEFQAVQFMPLFIGPQLFLCGLFVPKEHMPDALAAVADVLPMTWAVDSVADVVANETVSAESWGRVGLLAGIVVVFLFVASRSMPRQTR